MLSCCCRSRQTGVLRRLGLFVVNVMSSCKSVAKCFSVSLTAFPRSQSFHSSASTLGGWPIFIYLTLLTSTYLAQWTGSLLGPISPTSIEVSWVCLEDGQGSSSDYGCWRCGKSQKGTSVHCSLRLSCG